MSSPAPRSAVVVLGAGSGSRVGAEVNKVLLPVAGWPLLAWSVATALEVATGPVVVVCRPGERDHVAAALQPLLDRTMPDDDGAPPEVWLVDGGATRHASEQAALHALRPRIDDGSVEVVAIHDGARPLADAELYGRVLAAAARWGGAVPTHDLPGLLPRDPAAHPDMPPRLAGVSTPQAFRAAELVVAYDAAADATFEGTDTAATYVRFAPVERPAVAAVPLARPNLKVTYAEDVATAERLLSAGR